jgi:polyvinyl alcohol dehydrogenase (cytochrome)
LDFPVPPRHRTADILPADFVGSEDGTVYALDTAGRKLVVFPRVATVKTAISVGNQGKTAFFGDTNGFICAEICRWLSSLEGTCGTTSAARIASSPLLWVPACTFPSLPAKKAPLPTPTILATFRGTLVALDTASGKQIWQAYTINAPAKPTRQSARRAVFWPIGRSHLVAPPPTSNATSM